MRDESQKRVVRRNIAHVKQRRSETSCVRCGGQPIEWHAPDHAKPGRFKDRVSQLAHRTYSIARIEAEIAKCEALCRRCHMNEDGRMQAFVSAGEPTRRAARPPKRCIQCGRIASPSRRGLCNRCRNRKRYRELTPEQYEAKTQYLQAWKERRKRERRWR